MWYDKIFEELEKLSDENQAIKMANYMQNKFIFLGIPKPKLNEFLKPYLKESKNYELDWKFINKCYEMNYREAQYIAIEYLLKNINKIKPENIEEIKRLIVTKSWWETVDSLDFVVGELALKSNDIKSLMLEWSISDNIWLRRVSIDFQQRYKEKTNVDLFKSIIINNLKENDFFIRKAIGWSLREYSKVNPNWVSGFIDEYSHLLSKLSIKEASKYL